MVTEQTTNEQTLIKLLMVPKPTADEIAVEQALIELLGYAAYITRRGTW